MNHGPFAGRKFQLHPHRFQDGEQIAEDNCGIDAEPFNGCAHDFAAQRLGFLHSSKNDVLSPDISVFGQVAARLSHQPYGCEFSRFQAASFEKGAVVPRGLCVQFHSADVSCETDINLLLTG